MGLKDLTKRAGAVAFAAVGLSIAPTPPPKHKFGPNTDDKFGWLRSANIKTVFDIGANVGQFAVQINSIVPSATIYSFEPVPNCYEQLIFAGSEMASFSGFPFALGDRNGTAEIHSNAFSPSSSILPMCELHTRNFPFTDAFTRVSIAVKRLDDVAASLAMHDNILIKIDVQGYEDMVIKGGLNTIQRAKILIVETSFEPLYEGQPLFEDINGRLRSLGFRYRGALDQLLSPIDGRVLQADSIFMPAG